MNSDQAFGLVYGVLLLVLVGSALVVRRMNYGPMIRMAITWALIFAAAIFVAATWGFPAEGALLRRFAGYHLT